MCNVFWTLVLTPSARPCAAPTTQQHLLHVHGREEAVSRAGPSFSESFFPPLTYQLTKHSLQLSPGGGYGEQWLQSTSQKACAGWEEGRVWKLQAFGVQKAQRHQHPWWPVRPLFSCLLQVSVSMAWGWISASFHLQNKPVLSSNEPVFPAHTYSKCVCWIKRGSHNVGDAASNRNPWNGILSSSEFCSSLQAKSNINTIQSTFPYVDIFIKPQSLSLLFFSIALVSCTYYILTKVNSSVALWNIASHLWGFLKVSDFLTLASTSKCVWSPSHVALFIVETPHFAEEHISLLKKYIKKRSWSFIK